MCYTPIPGPTRRNPEANAVRRQDAHAIDAQGRPRSAPGPGLDSRGRVGPTRISGAWIGLVAAGVFLILLIIFIAQNLNDAPIHFLGLNGKVSIGLALLLAGV